MDNKDCHDKKRKKRKTEYGDLSIDMPIGESSDSGDSEVPKFDGGSSGGAGSSRSFVPQPLVQSTDINAETESLGDILPISGVEEAFNTVTQGITEFAGGLIDATSGVVEGVAGAVSDVVSSGALEAAGNVVGEVAKGTVEVAGEIIGEIISGS